MAAAPQLQFGLLVCLFGPELGLEGPLQRPKESERLKFLLLFFPGDGRVQGHPKEHCDDK